MFTLAGGLHMQRSCREMESLCHETLMNSAMMHELALDRGFAAFKGYFFDSSGLSLLLSGHTDACNILEPMSLLPLDSVAPSLSSSKAFIFFRDACLLFIRDVAFK